MHRPSVKLIDRSTCSETRCFVWFMIVDLVCRLVPDWLFLHCYWSLTGCLSPCLVADPTSTRCGSTLVLDDSTTVAHVAGPVSSTRPDDAVATYTKACPLHIAVRPGQSVNITLYSFSRHQTSTVSTPVAALPVPMPSELASMTTTRVTTSREGVRQQRFCASHVFVAEGERSVGVPLCAGPQRDRHLYLSRGQHATLYFSTQQRVATSAVPPPLKRDAFFILKIEGMTSSISGTIYSQLSV